MAEAALKINLSSPRKRAHNSAGPIADLIRSDGGRASDERVDVVGSLNFLNRFTANASR